MGGYVLFLKGGALCFEHVLDGRPGLRLMPPWTGMLNGAESVCAFAKRRDAKLRWRPKKVLLPARKSPKWPFICLSGDWMSDAMRENRYPMRIPLHLNFPDRRLDRVTLRFHDEPHRQKLVKILEMAE